MKKYVALLRGINVSGKNKIAMSELEAGMIDLGYLEVSTHLNSGNVIFSSDAVDVEIHAAAIKTMIYNKFQLDIPVLIVPQSELQDILKHAPEWWGNEDKEIYDNLIFLFPDLSYDAFYQAVGEPKEEYEKVNLYQNAVFWSFSRKDYQKTNWWSKTANTNIRNSITIRTANTVRKIAKR